MGYSDLLIYALLINLILIFIIYAYFKKKAFIKLQSYKNKLERILDSTGEAIYGIDIEGNCTFCNTSCIKLLNYDYKNELIGQNIHNKIHHSYKDGTPMPVTECKIVKTLKNGEGIYVDDEVFWTRDGRSFDVEYRSYPQFKNDVVVGGVVTFNDITERKKSEEEMIYLSCHDAMTGIYNRAFFQTELKRIDTKRNLPISVVMGDANGLKLTNDIFGHSSGDKLLRSIGDSFKKVCRSDDIIARIGGDEFVLLLPNTKEEDAKIIVNRIKEEILKIESLPMKASISLGIATKTSAKEEIHAILEEAENQMYSDKTLNRNNINKNQLDNIIRLIHETYPREALHSKNVSELSELMGRKLNLSKDEIKKLKDAGFLHDIGKVILSKEIINNNILDEEGIKEYKLHSVVGYRILNSFDDTLDISSVALSHHEHWDGTGYPKGLKGNEIPLLSRIIAVAESYDSMTNILNNNIKTKAEAIKKVKEQSGRKFDPEMVDILVKVIGD